MSLLIKNTGNNFIMAPEGLHIARCYLLVDLGEQTNQKFNKQLPKVLIGWELPDKLMPDGKPMIHRQSYTGSLNEKSHLRALLESWSGRGFTEEELKGFHLKSILGTPCYLTIKHVVNPHTQKTWPKIISICQLPGSVHCPPSIQPQIYFNLDEYSDEVYMAVPENIRKKINLIGTVNSPPLQHDAETHQPLPCSTLTPLAAPYQNTDDDVQDVIFK